MLAKVVMLYYSNAAHSVRMCIAVSSLFWSPQKLQIGSLASFDLDVCFLRLLWPDRILVIIAVYSWLVSPVRGF